MQFHSSKTKHTEFFHTLRGGSVPKSLRSTLRPAKSALDQYSNLNSAIGPQSNIGLP